MSRATVSHRTRRGGRRKPLTREQLLPLPAARARALALECYLALETMHAGHGGANAVASLLRAVYLAYVIDQLQGHVVPEPYREAEAVLEACALRAKETGNRKLVPRRCGGSRCRANSGWVRHASGELPDASVYGRVHTVAASCLRREAFANLRYLISGRHSRQPIFRRKSVTGRCHALGDDIDPSR